MDFEDEPESAAKEIAGTTRDLGSSLLQLSGDDEEFSDEDEPKTSLQQELADELFKKYQSGDL